MDETQRARRATTFGGVADVYERTRPDYPADAVRWLVGTSSARVLELACGTGQLTATLLGQGHQVIATDPTGPMLKRLRKRFKGVGGVRALQSTAEQIPMRSSLVDVVAVGQAFHWFDVERALPEIARVLRPGGVLALVWNIRDETVPWVRRLSRLIGSEGYDEDPAEVLDDSDLFEGIEHQTFRNWQEIDRDSLVGLVRSRSYVAAMAEAERAELLTQVGTLYDDYGRGHDGMLLPYRTECFRARVSGLADVHRARPGHTGTSGRPRRTDSDPFGDGLLIDFS